MIAIIAEALAGSLGISQHHYITTYIIPSLYYYIYSSLTMFLHM